MGDTENIVPGGLFRHWRIEEELGSGAFATVYLATDMKLGRPVALKVNRFPDALAAQEERASILREAQLVSRLSSPNIVTVYGVHEYGDKDWIFEMEYVDGGALSELLKERGRLPPADLLRILRGMLTGLDTAHRHGVIHRDVKPANLLLGTDGIVRLSDFGLGRQVGEASLSLSEEGMLGTPLYMAPEVVMGDHPTTRSDIWSVGVILHTMLAGKQPFFSRTLPALFQAIQNNEPAPLPDDAPRDLADLARRCLAKSAEDRPATCAEMLAMLDRMDRTPSSVHAAVAYAHTDIVGRERELKRFEALLDNIENGRGATVLLTGEAGIGKSMLAREVGERAQQRGLAWLDTLLTPFGGLVQPLLKSVSRMMSADGEDLAIQLSTGRFGRAAPMLRGLLTEEVPTELQSPQQTLWALEQLFVGLEREHPTVILVEDAHFATAEDLQVLKELGRRLSARGVLFLLTFRTGDPEGSDAAVAGIGISQIATLPGSERMDLGPLGADDIVALLEDQAGGRIVDPAVSRLVVSKSEGNPLFALVLFGHLREIDAITREEARITIGPKWETRDLPQRFRDLVEQRLEGIPERQRTLLDAAAVDGLLFDGEALADVLERPLLSVLRDLQRLYRERGLVLHRELGYRFAHAVFRDVIYTDLAPDLRRAIHRRLAEHLEHRTEPADAERLGVHWERAGERDRAGPHLIRAANEAGARQEVRRTIDLCRRAGLVPGQIAGETAVRHAETLFSLTSCLTASGATDDMEATYGALIDGARDAGDRVLELKTFARRASHRSRTGRLSEEDAERLGSYAEELPVGLELGLARFVLGLRAKHSGDIEVAKQELLRADEVFLGIGSDPYHASALDGLAGVALRAGDLDEAERLYAAAAEVNEDVGRATNAALSRINQVLVSIARGQIEHLEPLIEGSIRSLEVGGATEAAAQARVILGDIRYANGDLDGALAASTEATATLRRLGHTRGLCHGLVLEGRLRLVQGDLPTSKRLLEETVRVAAETNELETQVIALALSALACTYEDKRQDAIEIANRAVATAAQSDQLRLKSDLLLWLAEAVIFGLDSSVLLDAHNRLLEDEAPEHVRELVAGALTCADQSGVADLRSAALALRGARVGERRAAHGLLAGLLEAEGELRSGDSERARSVASLGRNEARALQHCWFERGFLGLLERCGDASARRQREELEKRIARKWS